MVLGCQFQRSWAVPGTGCCSVGLRVGVRLQYRRKFGNAEAWARPSTIAENCCSRVQVAFKLNTSCSCAYYSIVAEQLGVVTHCILQCTVRLQGRRCCAVAGSSESLLGAGIDCNVVDQPSCWLLESFVNTEQAVRKISLIGFGHNGIKSNHSMLCNVHFLDGILWSALLKWRFELFGLKDGWGLSCCPVNSHAYVLAGVCQPRVGIGMLLPSWCVCEPLIWRDEFELYKE